MLKQQHRDACLSFSCNSTLSQYVIEIIYTYIYIYELKLPLYLDKYFDKNCLLTINQHVGFMRILEPRYTLFIR